MRSNVFSAYDISSGLFTGNRIEGMPHHLPALEMVWPDSAFILGEYDPLSQKVDLETGLVVDYQPPSPGEGFTWNADTKRWEHIETEAEALETAKAAALEQINLQADTQFEQVKATYPESEIATWSKQETEARQLLAGGAGAKAAAKLLAGIAAQRGMTPEALAQKVVEKADAFAQASGYIVGVRQKHEQAIEAARTPAEVRAALEAAFPGDPNIDAILSRAREQAKARRNTRPTVTPPA